jgi:hypothetical protein
VLPPFYAHKARGGSLTILRSSLASAREAREQSFDGGAVNAVASHHCLDQRVPDQFAKRQIAAANRGFAVPVHVRRPSIPDYSDKG